MIVHGSLFAYTKHVEMIYIKRKFTLCTFVKVDVKPNMIFHHQKMVEILFFFS